MGALDALIFGYRYLFADSTEFPERSRLSFGPEFSLFDDEDNDWSRLSLAPKVATTVGTSDATPEYVTLAELAVGESRRVDVVARMASADGSVRQSFKLSALVYGAAGPVATLDGGSLTDGAPYGTGTGVVALDLSAGLVRLKVTGIAATVLVTTYDAQVL